MNIELLEEIKKEIEGDVANSEEILKEYSHDASLFEVKPEAVVFPKNQKDVEKLVEIVSRNKQKFPNLSLTGRAAGTDMSGGPLNDSIIIEFSKYFNHLPTIKENVALTEPGVFYRDFETETLKHSLIFPSYPASKSICAMGGIVNNNSGGEKSLKYGKTQEYVRKINVVLSDGKTYEIRPLKKNEMKIKMSQKDFEGELYRKVYKLILDDQELILKSKPTVHKNSAGYNLWDVWNEETGVFDLTKLWVGAQGTLGLMLSAEIGLVPVQKNHRMVVIFLPNMDHLGEIIEKILPLAPESFESYDDNTLKLALRFFPEFAKQLGIYGMVQAGMAFLPAFVMMALGHLPKLILQIDFAGETQEKLKIKVDELLTSLKPLNLKTQVAIGDKAKKYWLVRRESFNLLRNKIRDKHTAPFIDDFVIDPQKIQTVLPEVTRILAEHPEFIFTVAGHVGEGNFHIIPIVDIKNPVVRTAIPEIAERVYKVITENGGSITGEHNDGLIRTPYLRQMFGEGMVKLFEQVKNIFDPQGIFNPRKKVKGDLKFAMEHIRQKW
ncbi:TPA: FAD-binding oxidoreductase [Candidatus Collierbacteria bacterium]|uniref:Oxidoreductase n=1 Tax=Candidatus Collierbacteria bacterium GW2011_GWB2_44_22 TaxID=1618387 RepID=A0A0G1HYS0_9BACT|nr:MAG: Oxidoreductase [Candidatus Collierbacteria bacterium GW2011_GWA2_44_13]KKT50471.1 MAG: Oxidoreductase [Candidatus Collierbacteria bacterium GW2011_GWB1_44_197]KKT52306.1 MAG: Oxidoreductase [Candidatus Collierbacteria bacterium GW2011_GWB2_44_22]KKT63226.1 MAG: Oxidoreductase [Candidatus Collierbacteria bacterium GW2011_GWD1_44_27]KKT65727.1 MAG: Oxidoreductase [Candidatus Collierbacteria bacterium GW2011_GWC2_44_30]KKT89009.1 MAG: Oxidoreductase [Candidatus Collierbacteria bacterium G